MMMMMIMLLMLQFLETEMWYRNKLRRF